MNDVERNEKIAAARRLLLQRQRKKEANQNPTRGSPALIESGRSSTEQTKEVNESRGSAPSPSSFFDNLPPLEAQDGQAEEKKVGNGPSQVVDMRTEATDRSESVQQENPVSKLFPESNFSDKVELEKLKESLEVQKHTIQILVTEKSELQVLVGRLQEELKNKEGSCEELSGRLRASRSEVGNLKSEVSHLREGQNEHNKILQRLERDLQGSTAASNDLRRQLEGSHEEIKDLKRRIDQGAQEKHALLENIKLLESQLSLASVKLQQMSNESVSLEVPPNNQLESENEELKTRISSLEKEKQQMAHQYEEYISSLNGQLKDLSSKYETALVEKEENAQRVNSLVAHIGELEKQIYSQNLSLAQQKTNIQTSVDEGVRKMEMEITQLRVLISEKDKSLEEVVNECSLYRSRIEELENTLARVDDLPDAKLLQAAMESDRVAASRAIEQNKELKSQLQEMEEAYISASNKSLELTTQLDQMERSHGILQEELRKYKEEDERRQQDSSNTDSSSQTHGTPNEKTEEPPMSPEAMRLLEEKFKMKMNELAELLEEKQRLEHLVIQLQSETETIGEYITLYQNQRILLQQRAIEKDQQMTALAKEREELRSKLAQLNSLVPSLIQQNQGGPPPTGSDLQEPEVEENTSEKILQLLDEIGTSSLIQDSSNNFHPCLYCSGKLITV